MDALEGLACLRVGDEVTVDCVQGVDDRGPIAVEGAGELAEGQAEALASEVDRELAPANGSCGTASTAEVIG